MDADRESKIKKLRQDLSHFPGETKYDLETSERIAQRARFWEQEADDEIRRAERNLVHAQRRANEVRAHAQGLRALLAFLTWENSD